MTLPVFNANTFPLDPGVRLLEASAGTGKTFALAHLVLRLVAERGVSLRRLLVVTFTEAAAAELRDRIGRRLQDGLDGLEPANALKAAADPVLAAWLATMASHSGPDGGTDGSLWRGRLLLALEELDGADITTIHGFCRRTLQRQALEAGLPPELRLETDAEPLIQQVVHDYWQQQVLPLPTTLVAYLVRRQVTPASLHQLLASLDGDPALRLDPLPAPLSPDLALIDGLPVLWRQRWQHFKGEWHDRGGDLEAELRSCAAQWRASSGGKTDPYSPKPRSNRCEAIDSWLGALGEAIDTDVVAEAVVDQSLLSDYFHPGPFSKVARRFETDGVAQPTLPQRPLLEAVADLLEGPAELVLLHACHWGRSELGRRRQRSGAAGFSQLLEGLDPGPDAREPGPLLRAVGERYGAALIDEFQDTDPIQWRILRGAFGHGQHQLVMVGDPKQSIYRFRGGDLGTYLEARGQADACFGLVENFRAAPDLITALNGLMEPGLPRSGLEVPPVQSRALRSGPLTPPIELLWLGQGRAAGEKLPSRTALERQLPAQVAAYVAELLERSLELEEGEGPPRPLQADDLCLLVSNHRQAEQLRGALERQGIASRLVSKADVFAGAAATALQRFLDAVADPADPNRLRLLAASPLLGWSAAAIAAAPPSRWSGLAGRLDQLARQLTSHGVLGILAELLGSEGLARLAPGGRLLADLQQVAQLVEERLHTDRPGPVALADWLRRLRLDPDRQVPEGHQAHSDREDGAVSVVTVHRSKGLEYPVVICPYLWQSAGVSRGAGRLGVRWQPPGQREPHLDLHLDHHWGQGYAAAGQHRLAEQAERERLAYVAATRAQHLLVLAWGPAEGETCNPLFPWLFAAEPLPSAEGGSDPIRCVADGDWRGRLEAEIGRRDLALRLVDPPEPRRPSTSRVVAAGGEALALGPVPQHRLDTSWGRSSYTSWTHSPHGAVAPAAIDAGRDTADPSQEGTDGLAEPAGAAATGSAAATALDWPEQAPLADFPRGATAGDCLHRILEQLDYRTSVHSQANSSVVERELHRAGWPDQPRPPLLAGLDQVLQTPVGGALGSWRLAQLQQDQRLNEMNFDLTLGWVRARQLAQAFRNHPGGAFGADYAEQLEGLPVDSRGFLTGSIDLVFTSSDAHDSRRWWVADWKSNWLGRRDLEGRAVACGPRHYGQAAMAELMAANHYPLQAHLYLVALHRYLGWRLPGYDPALHLGGYVYVFLRGTPGAEGQRALPGPVPGMFIEQPPLERLLALDRVLGPGKP